MHRARSRRAATSDDCQEAPSPILPATNELIWGAISFVVLLRPAAKFACPGIKKGMEARTERIRADLEAAETAKAEAERVLDEYRAQLADAKAEAGRIIEEARQQADALRARPGAAAADRDRRRMRAAGGGRRRGGQGPGHRRPPGRGRQPRPSAPPRWSSQRSLDRGTQTQLVENYIDQVGAARDAH